MANRIPENVLEEILGRVDIVELISGYIPLKRAGRNFKANCPFHHEKTASFMVSADKQIYHCFGCGAGGNAYGFLTQYERMDFIEAVRFLARKAGVILPETEKRDSGVDNLITKLYRVNELTAAFYQHNLSLPEGQPAKDYFSKRGISAESLKAFRLGVATDKWDSLINHLRAQGVPLGIQEKAGLILPKQSGGYYDRFRNRLVFPILDVKSRILGFGARVIPSSGREDKEAAKYINSPESQIYTKGRNLFGLNFAKDAIRENDSVAVVEGYLDFIVPHQEGFRNLVASLGTALTVEQASLLRRYTSNVVMVYDADEAGQMATLRSLDIFIEEGMNVKVATLPEGLDPDLFVRKNGLGAFRERVNSAHDLFDYKLKILKSRYNAAQAQGKAGICAEMLPTLKKIKNAVLKSEYIKKLGEALEVKEEALWEELKKVKDEGNFTRVLAASHKQPVGHHAAEKMIVKMMLEETRLISGLREKISPSDFADERLAKIVSLMFSFVDEGKAIEPQRLVSHLGDDPAAKLICETIFWEGVSGEEKEKVADDCCRRLREERLKERRRQLHEKIKSAQNEGNEDHLRNLMQEFHELMKLREV